MFSSEEILEDFVEAASRGREVFENYTINAALRVGLDPADDAQKFLDGDETVREEIRNKPRIIPKDEESCTVAYRKNREEELTLADAESIRVMAKNTSQRELARRFGVHHCTINRIIVGKTYRKETGREFKVHTWEHTAIIERWKSGEPINAIARSLGLERRTIKRILTKHDAVRAADFAAGHPEQPRVFKVSPADRDEVVRLFKSGRSMYSLAAQYGVTRSTIQRICERWTEERSREAQVQPVASGGPGSNCASADARSEQVQ